MIDRTNRSTNWQSQCALSLSLYLCLASLEQVVCARVLSEENTLPNRPNTKRRRAPISFLTPPNSCSWLWFEFKFEFKCARDTNEPKTELSYQHRSGRIEVAFGRLPIPMLRSKVRARTRLGALSQWHWIARASLK